MSTIMAKSAGEITVIDPNDPKTVLVCALGHAYGPQPERGVFRTTDGGATWTKVLFVDENTGCSDLAMDPKNPPHQLGSAYESSTEVRLHTFPMYADYMAPGPEGRVAPGTGTCRT